MIVTLLYTSTLNISWGGWGFQGVAGCTLLWHKGFFNHEGEQRKRAKNEHCHYFCWFGIHTAIFQRGNSSEALPSTHGALKAISPQSSVWNPLQLNNFLHLVNIPHRHPCSITALLGWHQSQPLSRSLLLPEEIAITAVLLWSNMELNEKHWQ